MAVKHLPTGIVHQEKKDGTTACGVDTRKNNNHWVVTQLKATCEKGGCKS
ncbi:hypothetical protein GAB14E_3658 [Colwellia psychrerythraea]|uniref:Uncharacterized protein n=1 Tax=Colwellia psychrerythraea TaxID=28229 RepID=A0A099KJH8_COLPS|nr:hypothetical protein GAB14E_3658 [Colwellia psychrerythraea]